MTGTGVQGNGNESLPKILPRREKARAPPSIVVAGRFGRFFFTKFCFGVLLCHLNLNQLLITIHRRAAKNLVSDRSRRNRLNLR